MSDIEEVQHTIRNHLKDAGHRLNVENALAAELLLEDPERDMCDLYVRVMDMWEHMAVREPEITPVENRRHPGSANVALFTEAGEKVTLFAECKGGEYRLLPSGGTFAERRAAHKRWQRRNIPGWFIQQEARRRRPRLTDRIQG